MALTDEQWSILEPLIGEMPQRADQWDGPGGAVARSSITLAIPGRVPSSA